MDPIFHKVIYVKHNDNKKNRDYDANDSSRINNPRSDRTRDGC